MSAMALGLIQGGLSIAGGLARNAAIEDAATKQYGANKLFIERDESVLQTQLQDAAQDIQAEAGAALSNLVAQTRQVLGAQAAEAAETNVYGNTAMRKRAVVQMREALAVDNVMQAAEAKTVDIQTRMKQVKYDTEARHAQNRQNYNNMMTQQQSSMEILAGGLSAGMSGYSTAQNIQIANYNLSMQKAQAGLK